MFDHKSRFTPFSLLTILLTLSPKAFRFAEKNHVKFGHLSVVHGLSNNMVSGIVQDNKGFRWFGTYGGLNRYDGYSFKLHRHDLDEPNNPSYHDVWGIDEYGDAFRKLYILEILNNDFRIGRQNRGIEKTGNEKMGGMLWT